MTKLVSRDLEYIAAFAHTTQNGIDLSMIPAKYLTTECPECSDSLIDTRSSHLAINHGDPHRMLDADSDVILIGCEGYYIIPPILFGIHSEWDDWTTYLV